MGNARWTTDSYSGYASATGHESLSREQLFASNAVVGALNPAQMHVNSGPLMGMSIRESRDSAENPESTPIIIGLDVTGSMGFVAEYVAKEGLAKLMGDIFEQKPVSDPHLLFSGIGDVRYDRSPLQVSQFEPDIKIIEQLRELYLESGGGGNDTESYDLPWYFAAFKTAHDAFDKRQKKGFVFTIGDELPPYQPLTNTDIEKVFGAEAKDLPSGLTTEDLLEKAGEKYKVFHILAEQGSYARSRLQKTRSAWKDLMGPNVIFMKNCKDLPLIILATLRIANGDDVTQVLRDSGNPSALMYAFDMTEGD